MTQSCPFCNASNRDTAQFCAQCAQPLRQVCSQCGADNPSRSRFCNQCGEPLGPEVHCLQCGQVNPTRSRFCNGCGAVLSPTTTGTGHLPPQTMLVDRYIILRRVGQGSMGTVYQAADARIPGKTWAVKEMSDAAITNPLEKQQAQSAFRQEAAPFHFEDVRQLNSQVPIHAADAVMKTLSDDPPGRWQTIREMRAALTKQPIPEPEPAPAYELPESQPEAIATPQPAMVAGVSVDAIAVPEPVSAPTSQLTFWRRLGLALPGAALYGAGAWLARGVSWEYDLPPAALFRVCSCPVRRAVRTLGRRLCQDVGIARLGHTRGRVLGRDVGHCTGALHAGNCSQPGSQRRAEVAGGAPGGCSGKRDLLAGHSRGNWSHRWMVGQL